jgi:hypothetical protein
MPYKWDQHGCVLYPVTERYILPGVGMTVMLQRCKVAQCVRVELQTSMTWHDFRDVLSRKYASSLLQTAGNASSAKFGVQGKRNYL